MRIAEQKRIKKEQKLCESRKTTAASHTNVEKLGRRIEFLKRSKFREYEQYTSGGISKDKYLQKKREIDAEISRMQAEIEASQELNEAEMTESRVMHTAFEDMCEAFRKEKSLTYDMAHAFVDRILVYPDARIEVQWRFRDCLNGDE